MTNIQLNKFKNKIISVTIPFLIAFFTWIVIMIYGLSANIQVVQSKLQMCSDYNEKILEAVEINKDLSYENNLILNQKAEKVDLIIINNRLDVIEKKVDKFHYNFIANTLDTTLYLIPIYYSDNFKLVPNNYYEFYCIDNTIGNMNIVNLN